MRKPQSKLIDCDKLKRLRQESGKTQEQVALETGLSRSAIAKMENGIENASVEDLIALANCYDTTTDYLLGLCSTKVKEAELKDVCNYIGLDEKCVYYLHYITKYGNYSSYYRKVLNHLFTSENFRNFIDTYVKMQAAKAVRNIVEEYVDEERKSELEFRKETIPKEIYDDIISIFSNVKFNEDYFLDNLKEYISIDDFISLFDINEPKVPDFDDYDNYDDNYSKEDNDLFNQEEYNEAYSKYEDEISEIENKYDEFCKSPFSYIKLYFGESDLQRYKCIKYTEKLSDEIEEL